MPAALLLGACSPPLSDVQVLFQKSGEPIRGAEVRTFDVRLDAGKHILIEAMQSGIDIGLTIESPVGGAVSVNSPMERENPEFLYLYTGQSGNYVLTFLAIEHAGASGHFSFELTELPERSRQDLMRIEAVKQWTEGARKNLRADGLDESEHPEAERLEAAARYRDSAAAWLRLMDHRHASAALFCSARLEYRAYRWQEAIHLAESASAKLGQNGEKGLRAGILHLQAWALLEAESDDSLRQALQLLAEAREIYVSLGDAYGKARINNTIGLALFQDGNARKARTHLLSAAADFAALGEEYEATKAYNNIAKLDERRGELRLALASYKKALDAALGTGDSQARAIVLENYADTLAKLGDMEDALVRFHQAAKLFEASGDRLGTARTFDGIGVVYYRLGSWAKAIEYLRRSLSKHGGESEILPLAETHMHLGNALRNTGKYDEAIRHHKNVLELVDRPSEQASAHIELGRDYRHVGERRIALEHYNRAVEIAQSVDAPLALAYGLQERGSLIATMDSQAGLVELTNALARHRAIHSVYGEAQTLAELARIKQAAGATREALIDAEQALAQMEGLRRRAGNPRLRYGFSGLQRPTYELQIDLLMDLHAIAKSDDSSGGAEYASRALEVSERAHARTLSDLLYAASPEDDTEAARELRRQHEELRRRLAEVDYQTTMEGYAAAEGAADAFAITTELDVIEARIRELNPRFETFSGLSTLATADIQELLASGRDVAETMLIEYMLGDTRSVVWAVTSETIETWILPGRKELEKRAKRVHSLLSRPGNGSRNARLEQNDALTELGELLLGPVAHYVDMHRLVIVPDGGLHFVPFGALRLRDESAYLAQRAELIMLPSATVLAALRSTATRRPVASKAVAIIADPVFGMDDGRLTASLNQSRSDTPPLSESRLSRLPYTAEEARAILDIVANPAETLSLMGYEATRSRVLSAPLSEFRMIHIGSHGLIDAQHPELSAIAMTAVKPNGERQPNLLRLGDIYSLELNADLVVLSACNTALGAEFSGEGLVGLTQAFIYAGTNGVIASLWAVQDRATSELMQRLYANLIAEGMTPPQALRSAQLSLAADDRWSDPFFWAPFFYQGDWIERGGEILGTVTALVGQGNAGSSH